MTILHIIGYVTGALAGITGGLHYALVMRKEKSDAGVRTTKQQS